MVVEFFWLLLHSKIYLNSHHKQKLEFFEKTNFPFKNRLHHHFILESIEKITKDQSKMTRVYVVSGSDEPKKVIQTELLRTIKHVNCAMLIQDELISPQNMIGGCDTYSSHREMSGTHCNNGCEKRKCDQY